MLHDGSGSQLAHASLLLLITLALATTGHARAATTRIYRCDTPSGPVFSDRPCGEAADVVAIDEKAINTYPAAPASSAAEERAERSARSKRAPRAQPAATETSSVCTATRARIRTLEARMRAGYGGREGERLRDRMRELKRSLHVNDCR